MHAKPLLQVHEIRRDFTSPRQTIGPFSLEVHPGECFGLVGANGAGKTTLLRLILGLDVASAGSVTINGQSVVPFVPTLGAAGMIEEPQFFARLSAEANLRAAFPQRRLSGPDIDRVLLQVGLGSVGRARVKTFSQGMRQRLGIARVLMASAQLVILDEPTNGMDPVGIRWLRTLVRDLNDRGVAVILSSHMLHEVQANAHRFLMLDHGRQIVSGNVADIQELGGLEDLYFSAVGD